VALCTQAASAAAIATYGMVDIAALHVTTTRASGSGDMQVGANCAEVEVKASPKVAVREAQIRVNWDSVQVSSGVQALKFEHVRTMPWRVERMQKVCSRVLIEPVR
jgi:hypothetical protein